MEVQRKEVASIFLWPVMPEVDHHAGVGVTAAGCIGGALFQELPVWLGDGEASVATVGVVYVGVALLGAATAASLPRREAVSTG